MSTSGIYYTLSGLLSLLICLCSGVVEAAGLTEVLGEGAFGLVEDVEEVVDRGREDDVVRSLRDDMEVRVF